jgi:hypothetical protein
VFGIGPPRSLEPRVGWQTTQHRLETAPGKCRELIAALKRNAGCLKRFARLHSVESPELQHIPSPQVAGAEWNKDVVAAFDRDAYVWIGEPRDENGWRPSCGQPLPDLRVIDDHRWRIRRASTGRVRRERDS